MARHGGGAFSGKDPSKVDRSAAYAARWVAKNIVAGGLADRCEVQVAYAIGVAHPVSVMVETFGTEKIGKATIAALVDEHFDLRPGAFRKELDLHRPIYQKTAAYGHFGRDDDDFTWEQTGKADILREAAGLSAQARLAAPAAHAGVRRAAPSILAARHARRTPLRPRRDRAPLAAGVGGRGDVGGRQRLRRPAAEVLRARHAALPQRRAAHRPSEGLLRRRRGRAFPSPHGPPRAEPDGLRRVRPAGREPRDRDRPAPARLDRRGDRAVSPLVSRVGHLDRLDARVRHARAARLPLDAVDLPGAVQARPGLPEAGGRQLGSGRGDRAGQRAGQGRPWRAFGRARRGAPADAVVLQDHRLRRQAARGSRHDPLARARQDDAAQLDRALGGRGGRLSQRAAGDRLPGLHDAAGHAVRGDVLRHGARAPRRAAPDRGDGAGGCRARVRQPRADVRQAAARRRRQGEDRRAAGAHGDQPRQRRAAADVRRRLRADGVRDGRDHGRAGARRARLRVRAGVRAAGPARDLGSVGVRGSAVHGRWAAGQLRLAVRRRRTTARRSRRSCAGSTSRAWAIRRSTTACATG